MRVFDLHAHGPEGAVGVGDPAMARRAAEMGLDSVEVAASYDATRAGTPLHLEHRIFEADPAAVYLPRAGRRLDWDPAHGGGGDR